LIIKLGALAAGLNSEPQNIEYRTAEYRRMVSLRSVFFLKIDRIHPFDIRQSTFGICRVGVFFSIRPAVHFGRRLGLKLTDCRELLKKIAGRLPADV